MPNVSQKNGIDMGNIASINSQTVSAGGGAYDPVNETGTYTTTVPTSGLIQMGGAYREVYNETSAGGKNSGGDTVTGFVVGTDIVRNYSSDLDGRVAIAETSFSGTVSKIVGGYYGFFIIDTQGQLWGMQKSSTTWGLGGSETRRTFTKATGIGDSDTGWTDIAMSGSTGYAINSGKLYVIGSNSYSMFGDGTTTSSYNSWKQIGTDSDWVAVACGSQHAAAIKGSSNTLYTCGSNGDGKTGQNTQSGNTTTWTAVDATNLVSATNNNFTYVYCSYHHTVGIQSGRAFGCGKCDNNEQLGMNYIADQEIMIQTGSVGGTLQTDWTKVYANGYSSHLINSSGHLYHQGGGQYYLSGDGTTTDHKTGDAVRTGTWTDAEDISINNMEYYNSYIHIKRGGKLYFVGYTRNGNIFPDASSSYVTQPTLIIDAQANGNGASIIPDGNSAHAFMAQYQ